MIYLSDKSKVNKFIPKNIFYERDNISSGVKNEFINLIERITWIYKLSPDTIRVNKTDKVEEIQIFEILLKKKQIPKNAVKLITKSIAYPILFVYKFKEEFIYSVKVEDKDYYTEWNENIEFNFTGINLEVVFENIVKSIIKEENQNENFQTIINTVNIKINLIKQIEIIENKMTREKQFDRKVEMNKELHKLKKELEDLYG